MEPHRGTRNWLAGSSVDFDQDHNHNFSADSDKELKQILHTAIRQINGRT